MPTYEYECRKCGHHFEKFQRISDAPAKRCPKCRGAVRRLLSAGAGVIFKGEGFYATDYRSESYRKRAAEEKKASSGGESSGGKETGKSEGKTG
ncbi:FmdB family zinc ribbon protein [Kiritimatiella glycovorans]|uniref:Putative regulatory protein, FmdB family n=1 Tax=Kiritimatiella glycovorans TaxID=1307763 RepID=A0A0G3EGH4_9BACT|nr:zinc ribbon domain-containing protein [Kiritimatiella glycovorans]AKJ64512.1 putative regulatory protein, FmdB family [Kiritimatiella glycovorans]